MSAYPSQSLKILRRELDDAFHTLMSLARYEHALTLLKKKKAELDIPEDIFMEYIAPLDKFEELNYSNNYLFINIITVLETYLKDRIIEELATYPEKKEKLIKDYKIKRKLEIKDVLNGVDPLANEIINHITYHNFSKVNILYRIIFEMNILEFIPKELWNLVQIRHKLVHRTGKVDDKKIKITEMRILWTLADVSQWAENIDFKHSKGRLKKKHASFLTKYEKFYSVIIKHKLFKDLASENFARKFSPIEEIGDEDPHIHI